MNSVRSLVVSRDALEVLECRAWHEEGFTWRATDERPSREHLLHQVHRQGADLWVANS